MSRVETKEKDNKSINEHSNQSPSTSNFILDNGVNDLNSIQDEQTQSVDTTRFLAETVDNQLLQKQNHQENTLVNKKHTIFENNLVVEECDLFGKYIINQLRKFNDQTRALVKHKFQNILFEAEMDHFTKFKEEPQEHDM